MPTQLLSGKSALITGGARRIGRSIALACADAGANVAITYLASQYEAEQTIREIESRGVRALALECDIRSEDSVRAAVNATVAAFERLDLLVNNAAVFRTAPLESLSLDDWDAVFATNTRGPFLVSREALPHLRAARGRIVNLGSLGGLQPWAGHAHYCCSKAALHMLTKTMAKAFAPQVSVNCVAPGSIEQEDDAFGDAARAARIAERTPLQRNGAASDVAQAVLFFATGPSFVTGQILAVDGGLSLV